MPYSSIVNTFVALGTYQILSGILTLAGWERTPPAQQIIAGCVTYALAGLSALLAYAWHRYRAPADRNKASARP